MVPAKRIEAFMGLLLLTGTLLSLAVVIIGGSLYVAQNGADNMRVELLQADMSPHSIADVWHFAFTFTPLGIIQLGLLLLVTTQSFRVALLVWYYTVIRDYRFTIMSIFILLVLIYSTFWRN